MANQPLLRQLKKHPKLLEIEIQTIDGVQSQELDSVMANLTLASDAVNLGITRDLLRLNVMIPGAKMAIV